jgi:hypothetical protein
MKTTRPIQRFAQQRLRRLRMPPSIQRTRAAAARLRHGARADARSRLRIGAGRFTPMERVMRRCAVRVVLGGRVAAQVMLNVWQRAGTTAPHRHADTRPASRPVLASRVPTQQTVLRERVVVMQRTLHERLLERLEVVAASQPAGRAAMVVRVEQRSVYPRVPSMPMRAAVAPAAARAEVAAVETPPEATRRSAPADAPRPASSAAPLLAAQELARVTDHVIRQLDKRVLSYMERTGRA